MKPQAGGNYTVVSGDTLRNIARRAYGYDRSDDIVNANKTLLRDRSVSKEGWPYIYSGDVLHLPDARGTSAAGAVKANFDTEITIKIDGTEYRGIKASSIRRGMSTVADGFTFEVPFDYRNRTVVEAFRPFSYKRADLFIGGHPYISAICEKWSPSQGSNGTVMTIEARTKPGDMTECMSRGGVGGFQGQTLLGIGSLICKPYGLRAYSSYGDTTKFPTVEQQDTETDFDFLSRLAAQKGFLMTSAKDGNLLFIRPAVDSKPVASLRAGEPPVQECAAVYDGSKRFSTWYGYAESVGIAPVTSLQTDPSVPVYRPYVFAANETEADSIDEAVRWRMAKSIADAAPLIVPVAGWHNPDGDLWEENVKVTFWGPGVYVFEETTFIVKAVELQKDPTGGDVAQLSLVLPGAYNKTMPKSFPWDGYPEAAR